LDLPVIVASSPTQYGGWTAIIRSDQVTIPAMITTSLSVITGNPNPLVGPTLFNAYSASGVPSNAKAVILDAGIRTTWPDGNIDPPTVIMIRKTPTSPYMCLVGLTNADGGNAGATSLGQGTFPLHTDGTFYWIKTTVGSHGSSYGYFIRIIGYVV